MNRARTLVTLVFFPTCFLVAGIANLHVPPATGANMASADASAAASASVALDEPVRFSIVGRIENDGFQGIEVAGDVAFLAHERAALIAYDLGDPPVPRELGRADFRGGGRRIVLDGDLALVAVENGETLLFDVSNPVSPRRVGTMGYGGSEGAFAARDGIGYMAAARDLVLLDLATPAAPRALGRIELDYFGPAGIALSDRLAFIPQRWDRLRIVDISDPMAPTLRGSLEGVDGGDGRGTAMDFDGTFAYLGESVHGRHFIPTPIPPTPGPSPTGPTGTPTPAATPPPDGGRLSVVDVSDPDAPVEIGRSEAFYGNPVRHVHIADDLAWLITERGVRTFVLDISDPTQPTTVSIAYDPPPSPPWSLRTRDVDSDGRYTYLVTNRELLILRRQYERGEHAIHLPWCGGGT